MALTRRQRMFAAAVVKKGGNASAAARELGIKRESASVQAAKWMALPHVAAEVDRLTRAHLDRFGVTVDRVLQVVAFGAFVELPDIFDDEGETVVNPREWPIEVRASVESIEVVERMREATFVDDEQAPNGRRYVPAGIERRYKVKLVDKTAHRTLLMRHLGQLVDRKTVEHKHTLETIIGQSMRPRTIEAQTVAAAEPLRLEPARSATPLEPPQAGGSRAAAPATREGVPPRVEIF